MTAWNALYGAIPLKPGQTVLWQGNEKLISGELYKANCLYLGTGGLSITGLILAKAVGATTIVTSSSDEKLEIVKSKFGADYCVNYKKHPEWSKEVTPITNGEGVDYILKNGGSDTIAESINCVRMGGSVSIIEFLSQGKEMPDVAGLA